VQKNFEAKLIGNGIRIAGFEYSCNFYVSKKVVKQLFYSGLIISSQN